MYYDKWTPVELRHRHVNGFLLTVTLGINTIGGTSWRWSITRAIVGASNLERATGYALNRRAAEVAAERAARRCDPVEIDEEAEDTACEHRYVAQLEAALRRIAPEIAERAIGDAKREAAVDC